MIYRWRKDKDNIKVCLSCGGKTSHFIYERWNGSEWEPVKELYSHQRTPTNNHDAVVEGEDE